MSFDIAPTVVVAGGDGLVIDGRLGKGLRLWQETVSAISDSMVATANNCTHFSGFLRIKSVVLLGLAGILAVPLLNTVASHKRMRR